MASSMTDDDKKLEKEFLSKRPPLAYAKLQGKINDTEPFEVVLTQLPVELGRGAPNDQQEGRINLGDQKSVSRAHARINWNADKSCFEMECLGKNGMYAAGRLIPKDTTVPLTPKLPIKIGASRFYFLPAVKSPCGVLSGLKLIQKGFEKATQPSASTLGLTVEETLDSIFKCFRDIEYEVGGRANLAALIKGYFENSPTNFKRVSISAAGEPRYTIIKPDVDEKKRSGTAAPVDAKKKAKTTDEPSDAKGTTSADGNLAVQNELVDAPVNVDKP
ncbi:hypothetical protein H310_08229 [Aphanomyces invadans]|uniref:FHA domain-containing protein n=1 Tax=Aphanomyces invadans TaxID=157072 RepID=A0A024TZH5_9STRA|nr:hypothetical protein H310_08229 [Aphanomyces invadans]ETV99570.1 hypothetical protein H310_08229 [Aphanomyces invadans]|eukprot:XP_008872126.1 hypothetical protein H310_08229 [Aphanomyces invadans]